MNEETPILDPMDSKLPWTVDDPRMWKEQCRVGDVAFQHLFCISKGKPVPNWVTEGLPTMYHTLSEVKRLREENSRLMDKQAYDREEIRNLRAENLKLLDDSTIQYNGLTEKIVDLNAQLKKSQQHVGDWKHIANLWQQRNARY